MKNKKEISGGKKSYISNTLPIRIVFSLFFAIILVTTGNCQNQPKEVDVVQNHYDPLLSANQREYRLWIETEEVKMIELFDRIEFNSTNDVSEVIDFFISSIKQIRIFMLPMAELSTQYGSELAKLIQNEADKERFMVLWRESQEGVVLVMDYDIQSYNNLLKLFTLFRDATIEEDDSLVFSSQELMNRYAEAVDLMEKNDDRITMEQQSTRSETVGKFKKAIDFAKEKAE